MDDFVQMMKDWRRMCRHYSDETMKSKQLSCVNTCPLGHNTACGTIEDALDSDIEAMAKEVAKWAAEHPEQVYPAWRDWLRSQYPMMGPYTMTDILEAPIPADIAEQLGIPPVEVTK